MTAIPALKVVVESVSDATLLRHLLPDDSSNGGIQYFAGQGKLSLVSLGRNILVHEGGPVLLVTDSDTNDLRQSEEHRGLARFALGNANAVVSGNFPTFAHTEPEGILGRYDVFSFVPEIEVVFFEAPDALERILKAPIPEEEIANAMLLPKRALQQLLQKASITYPAFLSAIDAPSAQAIASGKQAAALRATIQRITAPRWAALAQ